jgi:hypothetical protein
MTEFQWDSIRENLCSSVAKNKAMRGTSHGQASLPSAALPASGSRGRPIFLGPLSQAAPPHFLDQNKTQANEVNQL